MVKSKLEILYKPADRYFVVNNLDKDSEDIPISLPEPPVLEEIDGYGLHPDEQYFRRFEVPQKLKTLEKIVLDKLRDKQRANKQRAITGYKLMTAYWWEIEADFDSYKAEIAFIRKVWYHRIYGYWFFNDGKPTYITGRHFMFLNFFNLPDIKINNGYPEYRDRHRREYLFREYLHATTETFGKRDKNGFGVADENGNYEIIDAGVRLFHGDIHPKSRRNGSTMMGICDMVEEAERGTGIYSTIVSKDGTATEDHWEKRMMPFWTARELFLRPIWDGGGRPLTVKYKMPRSIFGEKSLNSVIDYVDSAGEVKKDGDKINGMLVCDEEGKAEGGLDVLKRWGVYRRAMATGPKIYGYSSHISTVEEMGDGASAFLYMMELSNFYQRDDHGQTMSGLAMMFYPAYVGREGFIDRFGMSVINKPTERQKRLRSDADFARMNKGARQYQQEERDSYLKQGTPAAMQSYREYVKKFPWRSSECWYGTAGNVGWDLEAIDKRMAIARKLDSRGNLGVVRGNLEWKRGEKDTEVVFKIDPEGKFEVDYPFLMEMIDQGKINQRNSQTELNIETGLWEKVYEPVYKTRLICGVDPFKYDTKRDVQLREGRQRQSDGGIAILWERDPAIDSGDDPSEWESRRFILTYRYRCEQDEYNEDALMACVLFGAMCYPERNVDTTWKHFVKRGYGGYLLYDVDVRTGRRASEPGRYLLKESVIELFAETSEYVKYRIHKEKFLSYMRELKSIKGPEDLTNHDLLSACGMALLGSKSIYGKIWERQEKTMIDISELGFSKRTF